MLTILFYYSLGLVISICLIGVFILIETKVLDRTINIKDKPVYIGIIFYTLTSWLGVVVMLVCILISIKSYLKIRKERKLCV